MVCKGSFCIKQATGDDLGEVLRLYKSGCEELGMRWAESCLVKKIIDSFLLAPCFLLIKDDNICGMAGLTVIRASHNGEESLADYMFYIEPEHRSIKTLNSLVREIKAFAKKQNLPIRLEFIAKEDEPLKRRLFRMNGFKVSSIVGEV